jgi:hypothetical protein
VQIGAVICDDLIGMADAGARQWAIGNARFVDELGRVTIRMEAPN